MTRTRRGAAVTESRQHRAEIGRGDQRGRAAVVDDVGGLVGREVPVDRGHVQTHPQRAPHRLEELHPVLEQHREVVAPAKPPRPQQVGDLLRAVVQLCVGHARTGATHDQRVAVGRRHRMGGGVLSCGHRGVKAIEEEARGVPVEPGVADLVGQLQVGGLAQRALHRQRGRVRREDDAVLAARRHVVEQRLRQPLRGPRGGHQPHVAVLQHEADRGVPPRVRAVDHAHLELGEPDADAVQVHRVLGLRRQWRPWDAGVEADGQVQLAALRVERVVDGVARRVHAVAPEARPDGDVGDRVVPHERLESAHGLDRAQQVQPAHAERQPVGPLVHVAQATVALEAELRQHDRPLDAVRVHVLDQFRQLRAGQERLPALEVVLLDPDHPLRLLLVAQVHVDQTVDRAVHRSLLT